MPRTAQPPYSHVENSTRAELDQLGLPALRAMVDVVTLAVILRMMSRHL